MLWQWTRNPLAVKLLRKNIRLNWLDNVTAVVVDAKHAAKNLKHSADYVIMNLSQSAREFLDCGILTTNSGDVMYFYDITHEDDLYGTSWGLMQGACVLNSK